MLTSRKGTVPSHVVQETCITSTRRWYGKLYIFYGRCRCWVKILLPPHSAIKHLCILYLAKKNNALRARLRGALFFPLLGETSMQPSTSAMIGAVGGAVIGAGVGWWLAPAESMTTQQPSSGMSSAASVTSKRRRDAPFLPAAASNIQGEILEMFEGLAQFHRDDPEAYDQLAATMHALVDIEGRDEATTSMVLKANRHAADARRTTTRLRKNVHSLHTGEQVEKYNDLESKLHSALDDRVKNILLRRS